MLIIRNTRKDEVNKLQLLDDEVFVSDQKNDPDLDMTWAKGEKGQKYFSELLNDPSVCCLLAEDNTQSVGYLTAGPKHVDYRMSKCAEIYNMGVNPDYRSKGIGSMLIQKCLVWAKTNGYHKLYVSAYFGNQAGIKFYKKNEGYLQGQIGNPVFGDRSWPGTRFVNNQCLSRIFKRELVIKVT